MSAFDSPTNPPPGIAGFTAVNKSEAAVLEREPEDVEHHRRVERPPGPELPAGEPAPAGEQQPPAAPGQQRDQQLEQQEQASARDQQIERRPLRMTPSSRCTASPKAADTPTRSGVHTAQAMKK